MPNQTIDLRRGLEEWYDLDPRYYDNQRNQLADKSGHGRTAEASGGPTVGVEGPASFEATDFDGSDDSFDTNTSLDFATAQTAMVVFRPDSLADGTFQHIFANDSLAADGFAFWLNDDNSYLHYELEDTRSRTLVNENKWYTAIGFYDGNKQGLVLNGSYHDVRDSTASTGAVWSAHIGSSPSGDNFNGSIATTAFWSRGLSDAEIAYLNNLTTPPRSL